MMVVVGGILCMVIFMAHVRAVFSPTVGLEFVFVFCSGAGSLVLSRDCGGIRLLWVEFYVWQVKYVILVRFLSGCFCVLCYVFSCHFIFLQWGGFFAVL